MYFKQFYLGCLAHASYLIGSEGEAAVVDPQRDVDQYIEAAKAQGFQIKYVIETHLHADFVSGHRELAAVTGAEIVFGEQAAAAFPHRAVRDGDEIMIGKVVLRILETPGHTPESISLLVIDTEISDQPQKILTGDTLFVGDVGRPDLAGGKGYTPSMMAGMMYDTLHSKLLKLPNEVEVYPAHRAGSMCGRNMSAETSSTIGEQRQTNYALQPMSKDEFVRLMTTDLAEAPAYFPCDAEINRRGAQPLSRLPEPAALSPEQVRRLISGDWQTNSLRYDESQTNSLRYDESPTNSLPYAVLDVRTAADFGAGHVPGSINIGLAGQFAIWAGCLIPIGTPIVIVADSEEKAAEAVTRLARVGHENVKGYLAGGLASWNAAGFEVAAIPQMSVAELNEKLTSKTALQVIDVRRPSEYADGHVPLAVTAPLLSLQKTLTTLHLDPEAPTAVICAGGYRSSAAAGILQQHDFSNLFNVTGGTSAWVAAGFSVETVRE
ncbi:MAG TPA: MBL fold metallo-hydrolase [Pyrinomonadaceae bacterium]|jgi:glyoxylase-like metal-dependent hydrolase (beta-lactamase superfamily II)/rhodanese-related sulfurtransferase